VGVGVADGVGESEGVGDVEAVEDALGFGVEGDVSTHPLRTVLTSNRTMSGTPRRVMC
jgi:hypothetical protein